jgi:hypothetical protein
VDDLRHTSRRTHSRIQVAVGDEIDEGPLPGAVIGEVRIREVVVHIVGSATVEHQRERARIVDGERREHGRVEQAEDDRRHRDADAEGKHGDAGDHGAAANHPPAEAYVLPE